MHISSPELGCDSHNDVHTVRSRRQHEMILDGSGRVLTLLVHLFACMYA